MRRAPSQITKHTEKTGNPQRQTPIANLIKPEIKSATTATFFTKEPPLIQRPERDSNFHSGGAFREVSRSITGQTTPGRDSGFQNSETLVDVSNNSYFYHQNQIT